MHEIDIISLFHCRMRFTEQKIWQINGPRRAILSRGTVTAPPTSIEWYKHHKTLFYFDRVLYKPPPLWQDLLVLLDLLGTANPQFFSLVKSGDRWYKQMASAEQRLRSLNLLNTGSQQFFSPQSINGGIEDDHIPFMERNVPILHVIPTPFPDVWHTDRDDKSALDYKTIDDLNKILRVFVAEYLQMSV